MNALAAMADAAARFRACLLALPDCAAQPDPCQIALPAGVEWSNLLLSGPLFRHGHVESFVVPGRVRVLHVCLFPPLDDPAPVFGFDMIAGPARVTGIFLDLSPVIATGPDGASKGRPRLREVVDPDGLDGFSERRPLPDWGHIFSADMLAVRPVDADEVARAIALAGTALRGWLARPRAVAPACMVATGQARYIAAQRRNQHTRRMLAGFVGETAALRFINEVLFPPVPGQACNGNEDGEPHPGFATGTQTLLSLGC